MELNDNNKKTYIQIIIDSLNKKYKVLNELMQITSRQKAIVDADSFDEDFKRLAAAGIGAAKQPVHTGDGKKRAAFYGPDGEEIEIKG